MQATIKITMTAVTCYHDQFREFPIVVTTEWFVFCGAVGRAQRALVFLVMRFIFD